MSHVLAQVVWNPHTNPPAMPLRAFIAVPTKLYDPEDDSVYIVTERYRYHSDGIWRTDSGYELQHQEFWWCDEAELLQPLEELEMEEIQL